jgi:nucleoside 2-deoxyribosyltransferase
MDPGTAWEIGYGFAKRLPVFAWTSDLEMLLARTQRYGGHADVFDERGMTIEDFGLTENLMIANSCVAILANDDATISACAAHLLRNQICYDYSTETLLMRHRNLFTTMMLSQQLIKTRG